MGMDYVSKKKKPGKSLCSSALISGGATLSKMGLRGMLECYFVKIEIYLAAEIIIIYKDFF